MGQVSTSYPRFARQLVAALSDLRGNVVALDAVESTNSLARKFAADCLREGSRVPRTLLCAFSQWAGRGRRGNAWVSEAGAGVYATLLWQFPDREALALLPMQVAVALCQGVDALLGEPRCRLKWPNDLIVDDRKLGGILIEAVHGEEGECAVAIGLGINHTQSAPELPAPGATSLRLLGAPSLELGDTASVLARHLLGALEVPLESEPLVARFAALSQHRTGDVLRVLAGEERIEGSFLGFDGKGFLRLATAGGERALGSGEVIEG